MAAWRVSLATLCLLSLFLVRTTALDADHDAWDAWVATCLPAQPADSGARLRAGVQGGGDEDDVMATPLRPREMAAMHRVLRQDAKRQDMANRVLHILGHRPDRLAHCSVVFLVNFMPDADLDALKPSFVAENVRGALRARKTFHWASLAPLPVFYNDVLPYASLTEPRDPWRPKLFEFMREATSGCLDAVCAALALNSHAWEIVDPPIIFVAAKPDELNSYSPFQTMARHNASCTGLSVFLVDALRAAGVPSRIAGVPHWNKGVTVCPGGDADAPCGNHNWVEVFVDGGWHFLDQRGAHNELDRGWFFPADTNLQVPAGKDGAQTNHSIFSSSWAPGEVLLKLDPHAYASFSPFSHFPMVWDWAARSVPAWESVAFYHRGRKGRAAPGLADAMDSFDDLLCDDGFACADEEEAKSDPAPRRIKTFNKATALTISCESWT
ncbi:Alpha-L-fucosidase [Durusdinium trenchii]|uniref:Alpha-L-fucosidase n=1 Tax=Durusdinium trenchii TaxID=1381693 RepID=A0ABP0I7Q6_9DINO